jgi:hypothetical protein
MSDHGCFPRSRPRCRAEARASIRASGWLLVGNVGRRLGGTPSRFCLAGTMRERSSASSALMPRGPALSAGAPLAFAFAECDSEGAGRYGRAYGHVSSPRVRVTASAHVELTTSVCDRPIRQHPAATLATGSRTNPALARPASNRACHSASRRSVRHPSCEASLRSASPHTVAPKGCSLC